MTTEGAAALAAREQTGFLDGFDVEVTATGLVLPPDMPFEKYTELVQLLGRISSAVPWYIGSTVVHGEAAYGEAYAQAMNDFGLAYQTLANYAHVCRWVLPEQRRDDLSFGHHAAVANMTLEQGGIRVPDTQRQEYWLAQAVEKGWSRSQMREAIAADGATTRQSQGQAAPGDGTQQGEQPAAAPTAADEERRIAEAAAAVGQPPTEASKALRDVLDMAVPVTQLAVRAGGYWAVPEDVMAEVAQALGEVWEMQPAEPGPAPVIEGTATVQPAPQQVPAPQGDDDVPMGPPAPVLPPGPAQQQPVQVGETFDGF